MRLGTAARNNDIKKKTPENIICEPCGHNIYTHFPKSDKCEICMPCKPQRAQVKKKKKGEARPDELPPPKEFADCVTGDHMICGKEEASRHKDTVSLVILDRFHHWLRQYPAPAKSADEIEIAFQKFLGPQTKPKHVYTDGSEEFKCAFKKLK